MNEQTFPVPTEATCWFIENEDATIAVERTTGLIRGCTWKRTGLDLFRQVRGGIPGYRAGIRIYDEHDDRWYDDWRTPFTVSDVAHRGQSVEMTRQYEGAPFAVRLTLSMDGEILRWQVRVTKCDRGVPDRSLRVYFSFPLIAGWDVWAPCKFGETTFDGMTPFEFMYVQVPYVSDQEIILPMVSHYNRKLDVGYSLLEPIDALVPAAKFVFNNGEKCFNWGAMHKPARGVPMLEAVNYYIGLVGERPMTTEVMMVFHQGDWRPGLGKVYKRWQEYFDPANPAIYERCGVGKLAPYHLWFEEYGDYFYEGRDRWYHILVMEGLREKLIAERNAAGIAAPADGRCISLDILEFLKTHTEAEIAARLGYDDPAKLYTTRQGLARNIAQGKARGQSMHLYFNYSDCFRPTAERKFPDAICTDEDGRLLASGWYMCHNMNPDPRWSFGQFCYKSAKQIFDAYPELDGLFIDSFRHYEIDFAHDDGVTVVNGKPCYSISGSYVELERLIKTEIMLPRNKTSFANKPTNVRLMRYLDAQMLEGDGDFYEEKYCWASIASPLYYLWTTHTSPLDVYLRRAVVQGAWPREKWYKEEDEQYARYLPLYEVFRRRVLCFEPDPMRVPEGSRGKLYTVPGGYAAGMCNDHVTDADEVRWAKRPYALFRVARAHDVTRVGVMFAGDAEFRTVPFKFDGTFIAVPLDGYKNVAVVKLFVEGNSGKPIGTDTFAERGPMCCDPDSAFEDISAR